MYERIKKRAEDKNMSIRAVEQAAQLGNGTIDKWKKSKPNVVNLFKVCAVLECQLTDLLGDLYEKEN